MKRKLVGPLTKAEADKAEQHAAYNRGWSSEHSDKAQKIQRRTKRKKKKAGICTRCSNPRDPKSTSLCAECLEKGRQRSHESRGRNLERARKQAREGARRRRAAHPVKHRTYAKQRYAAKVDEILGKRRKTEGSIPRADYLNLVKRESRGIVVPFPQPVLSFPEPLPTKAAQRKQETDDRIDLAGRLLAEGVRDDKQVSQRSICLTLFPKQANTPDAAYNATRQLFSRYRKEIDAARDRYLTLWAAQEPSASA